MTSADAFVAARDLLLKHREDYSAACREFAWPKMEQFNWALDYFDRMAEGNLRTALRVVSESGGSEEFSFSAMSKRSSCAANYLRRMGVRRGDRILLMLGNDPPLWEAMLGAFKLGAVVIPATPLLVHSDLADRLERGHVRHVIASASQTFKFAALPGDYTRIAACGESDGWQRFADASGEPAAFTPDGPTRADDPLLLYFTSGTTSKPKLVLHSHRSYPVGLLSTLYWLGLREGDVHWNISSPGWAKHAWSCFFAPWTAGATVFIYNYARFNAPDVLRVLVQERVTSLCAPPTVWRMIIQEPLSEYAMGLRSAISAGEPLNPEVIEQVRSAWGLTIRDGYGQTETTALIGNSPGAPVTAGSMGRPMPGYCIVLLDADGKPADEGEVCIDLSERPAGLMLGYSGDAEKTADATRDGYYRTGDIARRDAAGAITFIGRADDVFKASDYRLSPFELESVLIEHPAVAEAAVAPSPDPLRLAVPKAFLALAPGHTPCAELARDIFAFTRERLAPYKRIRRLEFCELPKTVSGKIRRVDLRRREQDRDTASARAPHEYFLEDFQDV